MGRLKLHEAMAVVLLTQEGKKATTEWIAKEINRRELYQRKDGQSIPDYQIMQRVKLSGGKYQPLFEWEDPNLVRLK